MMKKLYNLKDYTKSIIKKNIFIDNFSLSFAIGNLVAMAPIIPFQTPIAVLLSLLLKLNKPIVISTLYIVNNPFTMIPIYLINYFTGLFFTKNILSFNLSDYNPQFIIQLNNFISKYINLKDYLSGEDFCIWYLIIGGIIFPIITALIIYTTTNLILKIISKKSI